MEEYLLVMWFFTLLSFLLSLSVLDQEQNQLQEFTFMLPACHTPPPPTNDLSVSFHVAFFFFFFFSRKHWRAGVAVHGRGQRVCGLRSRKSCDLGLGPCSVRTRNPKSRWQKPRSVSAKGDGPTQLTPSPITLGVGRWCWRGRWEGEWVPTSLNGEQTAAWAVHEYPGT